VLEPPTRHTIAHDLASVKWNRRARLIPPGLGCGQRQRIHCSVNEERLGTLRAFLAGEG